MRPKQSKKFKDYIETIKDVVEIELNGFNHIVIHNVNDKYATIRLNRREGFEISTSGTWLKPKEALEMAHKIEKLSEIATNLNKLYKPEKI